MKGVRKRCRKECPPRCRRHTWSYRIDEIGPDGRRHTEEFGQFETAHAASEAREARLRQIRSGAGVVVETTTVADALRGWLTRKVEAGLLRPSTAQAYQSHLDLYWVPRLGALRWQRLRQAHIERALQEIRAERPAMSPATQRRIVATLRSATRSAMRRGELMADPAAHLELPRGRAPRVQPWEPSTFLAFIASVDGDRLAPAYWLAALTGLRLGEVAGLRWVDLDLDAERLVVRQSIVRIQGGYVTQAPKSEAGTGRVVDLDGETVARLRAWRARQSSERLLWGAEWTDTGLVFTREDGLGVAPDVIAQRFTRAAKVGKFPHCRFHDLRHLSASLQLAGGVPLAVVSKRLGHSSTQITGTTYSHLLGGVGKAAADAALEALRARA